MDLGAPAGKISMKIYDITRTLTDRLAVWPEDRPYAPHWSARIAEGSSVNIGAFEMSTHAGTHVDAPLHYKVDGAPVDDLPLDAFIGPAFVVEIHDADAIGVHHIESLDFTDVPRVLFKTRSSAVPDNTFDQNFVSIEPTTIRFLAERRVVLIGTDAPSVDPFDSSDLPAHHELARSGIVNLENLSLSGVHSGLFHLTALPLKLSGLDASPVRAILTPLSARRSGSG